MSNIWESMQRGLEKASQEAARIGRIQRLRSTVDSLSRQLTTQNNLLLTRAMEVFDAGQMTQSELRPICQDLAILRQQLDQAQNELRAIMNLNTTSPSQPGQPSTGPHSSSGDLTATIQAPLIPSVPTAPPPPGYPTLENTIPAPPPPPPGFQTPTVSALDTLLLNTSSSNIPPPPPGVQTPPCPNCQAELVPGYAYCHNCGFPIDMSDVQHLPTMRSGFYQAEQEAVQSGGEEQSTVLSTDPPSAPPPPPHITDLETIRGEIPAQEPADPQEKDGGK